MIVVEEVSVAPEGVPRRRISTCGRLAQLQVVRGEALAVIAMRPPRRRVLKRANYRRDPRARQARRPPKSADRAAAAQKSTSNLDISPATSPETPQKMEQLQSCREIVEENQEERRAKAREDILASTRDIMRKKYQVRTNSSQVQGARGPRA